MENAQTTTVDGFYTVGTGKTGFLILSSLWIVKWITGLFILGNMATVIMIIGSSLYAINQGYILFTNLFGKRTKKRIPNDKRKTP